MMLVEPAGRQGNSPCIPCLHLFTPSSKVPLAPSNPKWSPFSGFYFPKRYAKSNKNTLGNPYLLHKPTKIHLCRTWSRVSTRIFTHGLSIGARLESHLSQPFVFPRILLLFRFVNKNTYVFVVRKPLEAEKRTNKRNKPADTPMTGFEPAPLQRPKREGNKIDVLPYLFDQRGESI
jgi:hypothetical protein